MKKIPLTKGKSAIIDDLDYWWVSKNKWYFNSEGYAARSIYIKKGKYKTVKLHRIINCTPDGCDTDHVNRNKLDNRRGNLRTATKSQNSTNCKPRSGSSIYRGVFLKKGSRWCASISYGGRKHHLGYFGSEEEAAKRYNQEAILRHGQFAQLNKIEEHK